MILKEVLRRGFAVVLVCTGLQARALEPGEVALTFLDRANELHTATCAFGTNPGAGRPARGDGDGQEWLHATATCDSAGCSCA